MNYHFDAGGARGVRGIPDAPHPQPHFANARSVRNALDRARLRQASRLFADRDRELTPQDLTTIEAADIRASRVFAGPGCPRTINKESPAMHLGRTTLSKFLIQQLNGIADSQDLGALLVDVAAAVKAISAMTAKGALGGIPGRACAAATSRARSSRSSTCWPTRS